MYKDTHTHITYISVKDAEDNVLALFLLALPILFNSLGPFIAPIVSLTTTIDTLNLLTTPLDHLTPLDTLTPLPPLSWTTLSFQHVLELWPYCLPLLQYSVTTFFFLTLQSPSLFLLFFFLVNSHCFSSLGVVQLHL